MAKRGHFSHRQGAAYSPPPPPRHVQDNQARLKRAVLAACNRLKIEDDERRDISLQIVKERSLKAMSTAQLSQLLDHLNRGWDRAQGASGKPYLAKIRALWWSLYWLGEIADPHDEALLKFCKRQTGVEKLVFLGHMKAPSVIEALKSWLERAGVMWWSAEEIARAQSHPDFGTNWADNADRHAVLSAIGVRLADRGVVKKTFEVWLAGYIGISFTHPGALGPQQLDSAIRYFGRRLREASEAEAQP